MSEGGVGPRREVDVQNIVQGELMVYISYDGGTTWVALRGDSNGRLSIDINSQPLPTGAATEATLASVLAKILAAPSTEAKQDTMITALQVIDNFISGARGLVTEDNSAAILTALQVIDNMISGTEAQVDIVAALPTGTNVIGEVKNEYDITVETQRTWTNLAAAATNTAPSSDTEIVIDQARDCILQVYQTGSTSVDVAVISTHKSGGNFDDYDRPLIECNLASTDRKTIIVPVGVYSIKFRASNPGTGTATSITADLTWRK